MYTPSMLAAAFLGWVSAAFACTAFLPSIMMNFAARDCCFTGWFCVSFSVGVTLNIGEWRRTSRLRGLTTRTLPPVSLYYIRGSFTQFIMMGVYLCAVV